ncbi:MAG: efflux RND transporter periplasmic adaptor subunit [Acidobacteriota bacterium]
MRRLRLLIILLLLGGGAVGGYLLYTRSAKKPGPAVEAVAVDRGRIEAKLMASGTLNPLVTVQVGSQVSGRIKALHVDFNDVVKKGQLIAKIDPQLFQAALDQARANQLAAEANLAKARVQAAEAARQHTRTKALAGRKLVAPADEDAAQAAYDSARAQVTAAEASLSQARATLSQARVNLAYTTIVSPIDGVVISRNVDVGQTVAASLQAPTLFTIAEDLAKMQIHTSVPEADIGRVRAAMPISFTVDAFPRERFAGVVHQIRNAPQTVQNVVTYNVIVNVENPDLRLRPGMTANVTFVYAEAREVLRVPNAALRFQPPPELLGGESASKRRPTFGFFAPPPKGAKQRTQGARGPIAADRREVWVMRGGSPAPVSIKVGISDGTHTEVVEGLREGEEVVVNAGAGVETKPGFRGPGRGRGVVRRL